MKLTFTLLLAILMAATAARAQDQEQERPVPDIGDFYNATAGNYQVFAQDSQDTAWQVNRFMNEMLRQYSSYFSNWTQKDSARVIVFSNVEDFRAYAKGPVTFMLAASITVTPWGIARRFPTGTAVYSAYAPCRVTPMISTRGQLSWRPLVHQSHCPHAMALWTLTAVPMGMSDLVPGPRATSVPACSEPKTLGIS